MADSGQEKTEQPTSRRRKQARQEGNVAKSMDLSSALVLMGGLVALMTFGRGMTEQLMWAFRAIFHEIPNITLSDQNTVAYLRTGSLFMIRLLSPFVITVVVVALLSHLLQSGWLFTTKPVMPQMNRIGIASGVKRVLSPRSWAEMAKGLIKILIVAWVAYLTLKSALPGFIPLMDTNVAAILAAISKTAMKLAFRIALAILILGILDFQFQKWQHLKQLKMTKQEVKDEWKQIEGDPHLKSHIRRIQMKLSMNRMIKKVPTADVVIANPVHLAVALKYDPESMSAPTVIAKGKRKMAEKIKAIAREHDIPVVEDPLLARALYKSADVGMQVPYDLYQAVAEVLAMVYRLREAA